MKKIISFLLSFVLLFAFALPAFAQTESKLVLAENGKTQYRIVISETASQAEKKAADTLADYFFRISAVRFQIVTDASASTEKEIVIGVTERDSEADIDRSGYGDEGVRIFTLNGKLFLTGGAKRGGIYSVYTFLEDYLGCRWFTNTLTVVPESSEISVPADIDYTYVPCFNLRQTYWSFSTAYTDYCVAHKLHGVMAYMSEEYGGCAEEHCVNSVHTLQWVITRDMFTEHPEYFGCDEKGNRSINRQPCLSNDDVLQLVINYAKSLASQYNVIFSISQNDGQSFCQCEKCREFNEAHGGTDSASMINFVNKVAEAVRKEYPEARFETLAYQDSLVPPTGLEISDGVVIRLCPVNGCVLHDFDDPKCSKNKAFSEALNGWAQLTDTVYMWNYSTNFQYYHALFPNITTLQARYRYFRDNNVKGVFDNGCGENMVPAEFHELRTYLVLKLLWDPDTDVERHIKEFCDAYYGEAADDVIKFIYQFENDVGGYNPKTMSKVHMTCQDGGVSLENNTALTEKEIRRLDAIMNNALGRQLTADEANRLQGLSLSWRFFKCGTFSGEFNWLSAKNNPGDEARKLCEDMKEYGIEFLTEGGGTRLGEGEPDVTVPPYWWYADESAIPLSVKIESKLLPLINKVLRTLFGFIYS